jgi:subfamily B ATP-binding cassette protein MsbA
VVITHRLSTIRDADFIHVLDEGRLVESGTWEELIALREGRFARLCRAQGIDHRARSFAVVSR